MELTFHNQRLLPTGKGIEIILDAMEKHNIAASTFVPEKDLIYITEHICEVVETSNHRNQLRINTTGDILNYIDYLKCRGD